MSRSPASSIRSLIPWGARARRFTRAALALLFAGTGILALAGCAGSEERAAVDDRNVHSMQTSHAAVGSSGRPLSSVYDREVLEPFGIDWQRFEGPRGDWQNLDRSGLALRSASALIVDDRSNKLYAKNAGHIQPIASITKLMMAMVVLDAAVSMETPIRIIEDDRDRLKNSSSRLRIGEARLPRGEMLMVALMSSDNRAAHALGRTTFKGGTSAFIQAMNRKAQALGMNDTRFVDPTGLDPRNRSTAEDLVKMVRAASRYPFIRKSTSRGEMTLYPHADGSPLKYRNTNPLVRSPDWAVEVSKTGYIKESGNCLVMQTRINNRSLYMVFLGANGKQNWVGDSKRVRDWIVTGNQTASR